MLSLNTTVLFYLIYYTTGDMHDDSGLNGNLARYMYLCSLIASKQFLTIYVD